MKYDISSLFKDDYCRVVFVSDPKDSIEIEKAVYARDEKYKHKINAVFMPKRNIGPFKIKNKKDVWDVLSKTHTAKKQGPGFLIRQLKSINLYNYQENTPQELSYAERLRASVLYDVLQNAESYADNIDYRLLLNDCYAPSGGELVTSNKKGSYFSIAYFLGQYADDVMALEIYNLIWITDMSPEEFIKELEYRDCDPELYSFFSAHDGVITELDAEELEKGAEAIKQKEEPKQDAVKESKPKFENRKESAEQSSVKSNDSNKEETTLRVAEAIYNNGDYMGIVNVLVQSGTVGYGDTYQSTRTGSKYFVTYPR